MDRLAEAHSVREHLAEDTRVGGECRSGGVDDGHGVAEEAEESAAARQDETGRRRVDLAECGGSAR